MNARRLIAVQGIILIVISLPFVFMHLAASPDDAEITPVQHVVAALANYIGPWGGAVVRLVDFPNAGMRSFNWASSIGLSVMGMVLFVFPLCTEKRFIQYALLVLWALFLVVWFAVGFFQIADGLL